MPMSTQDQKTNSGPVIPAITVEIPPPDNPAGVQPSLPPEYGGRKGPEATRYGDWEMDGKCVDF